MHLPTSPETASFADQLVGLMPRLRRLCLALAGNAHTGEDLAQAACERALARRDQFCAGTRLDHWLFRLARNLHIDRVRAEKSRGGQGESLDLVENMVGSDGVALVEARSDLAHVSAAFLALPEAQRELFVLVVLDGHSYREAAELLDLPLGTVMSRLARARAALDKAIHGPAGGEQNDR